MDEHFQRLLDCYFDGALDEEQRAEFEVMLQMSRERRAEFWRQAHLIEAIRKHGREARGVELAFASPSAPRKRARHIGWISAAFAAAAAVVIVFLLPGRRGTSGDELASSPEGATVAVVGHMAGAEWADHNPLQPGQQIPAGELKLERGLVALDFFGGGRVVVEGPAVLNLVSTSRLKLESGTLEIAVPQSAGSFTLDLPTSQLVSSSGTFEVKATGADGWDFWVREGSLEAVSGGKSRSVPAGEFAVVRGDGSIVESGKRPPPKEPGLAERLERGDYGRLTSWRQASTRRTADPTLLVHFRMDSPGEESGSLLVNSSNHANANRQASVTDARWVEGRWPGKRGLDFRGANDAAKIGIRGEHPQVTYAAWARLDELLRRYNAIFISERPLKGEAHWQFSADARFSFSVRMDKVSAPTAYHGAFSKPVIGPRERGVWKLLATTYDSASRQVIHYVDGKEFARATLPESIPLNFGMATLGNAPLPSTDGVGSRCFGGVIDEFLLYGRVLSPAEIESLYQEGRPD